MLYCKSTENIILKSIYYKEKIMVKHIVAWKIKEDYSIEQKITIKQNIKNKLENLKNLIPELVEISVTTELLPSSTADLMLHTLFETEADLQIYQKHPDHLAAAGYIRSVISERSCLDYEV